MTGYPRRAAGGFGPLKAVLGDILAVYTGHKALTRDPKRAAEEFGPLKAVLGDILAVHTGHKVRSKLPAQTHRLTMAFQGAVAVESSIKNIFPRIIALEEHLDSRPGDVAEHRRREELIRYV